MTFRRNFPGMGGAGGMPSGGMGGGGIGGMGMGSGTPGGGLSLTGPCGNSPKSRISVGHFFPDSVPL